MIRLDRLVNVLGGYGVRLVCCPVPRSTELRSVVMREPEARAVDGDVFLAVGADSVAAAVRWAVAVGASAVLVHDDGPGPEAAALGEAEGVAVLLVDPSVSWSQLAGVVYGLVLEGRETESGRGPTDLFALADRLSGAVGGAVVIEDHSSRVLAYSNSQQGADRARLETILGRQVPERLREVFERRGVFAHLAARDEPLFVAPDEGHGLAGRMVVAVRAGRELLGSVWVTCGDPLTGARGTALADGARTVALHLLRLRASADLERQVESDLALRLLEGTADAATALSRLGLPQGELRVVALRAREAGERHAALLLAFERATTGFGWSRPGRSTLAGSTLYTLLPGEAADAARAWIAGIRAALPERVVVTAGIGGVAPAAELPASRQEADECLALHESRPQGAEPPAYDESWDDILLQRLRAAARTGRVPARGPVAELRRHDRERGTRHVPTLRAWLESQGDLAQAGERLDVHPNTVRYRLRKMAEVTALDLDDPRKRLAMTIALAATDPTADPTADASTALGADPGTDQGA
ncbi:MULTISPECIES: CdaR family transcriptional regulator [Actinosynnema]|uniref:PucR family transcriptional regulator n=1 Tax=Actinosynnema TaxID=40566 RepID=UPI0020A52B64|nr:PucR family transcriptional regulator [Actinosynnema pretiosum]MCP2096348.1 PucR C-terminal helix-turn-helix domain-containing protein [Actinosynnema pretiosum]